MSPYDYSDVRQERGMLSKADRNYLHDREEYSRQGAHQRRRAIKKRVRATMADFGLLLDELTDEEWQDIAGYQIHPPMPFTDDEIRRGARDTLASMLLISGAPVLFDYGNPAAGDLETTLSAAFNRVALRQGHRIRHVNLSVDSEPIRYRDVMKKIEREQSLDFDDVMHLLAGKHTDIDMTEVGRMLREEFIDEETDDDLDLSPPPEGDGAVDLDDESNRR